MNRMNDDLISRKALLEILNMRLSDYSCDTNSGAQKAANIYKHELIPVVEKVPTAFDKEKVLEELKEMQNHSESCKHQCEFASTEYFDYMGAEVAYGTVIAIVEKGGIE